MVSTCMLSVPMLLSHASCGATSPFSHSLVAATSDVRAAWGTWQRSERKN